MRTVIHKLFWAWDFDKEEAWLNEMAARGLAMVSYGFCRYEFEPCQPGEYSIRIQLLDELPAHPESGAYLKFLEETGAEQVGSWLRWVYLRKKTSDGPFELFSDNKSKVRHLTGIITLISVITAINFAAGGYNIFLYFLYRIPAALLGCVNLALAAFFTVGLVRLFRKRKALQTDARLFD